MREGPAPQRAGACWTPRGTTEPGGVRASCGRDDSKIQDEQVGAGYRDVSAGPSRRATWSSITTPACHRVRATFSWHVRAIVRLLGVEHCCGLREGRSLPWQAFFSSTTAAWSLASRIGPY